MDGEAGFWGEEAEGGRDVALVDEDGVGMLGGREDARSREDGGCREFDELDIELDLGEEKLDLGEIELDLGEGKVEEVESFLDPGGELQREPRGETETPESQLSFLLRLPPPRPATWKNVIW